MLVGYHNYRLIQYKDAFKTQTCRISFNVCWYSSSRSSIFFFKELRRSLHTINCWRDAVSHQDCLSPCQYPWMASSASFCNCAIDCKSCGTCFNRSPKYVQHSSFNELTDGPFFTRFSVNCAARPREIPKTDKNIRKYARCFRVTIVFPSQYIE